MKHQEGFFQNSSQQSIYYQYWLPDTSPKAALMVIHGLNEHSGRYAHIAEFFTQNDIAVFSMDHIGHGNSGGTRSFVKQFSCLIDDLVVYLGMAREIVQEIPFFTVGHSLGGLISPVFLFDHQDLISGAILSGPLALVPDYVSPFIIKVGKIISSIFPKLGLLEIEKEFLSRDPAVVQAYINDPLVYNGKITVRMSAEMNKAIGRVGEQVSAINLPVLILHGGQDKIVDPACSEFLHKGVSSTDKELIIYDGFFHEIFNEPEQDQVFTDMLNWINKHI
jgi:acylglycerol lipase